MQKAQKILFTCVLMISINTSCKTYYISNESFVNQISNLEIEKYSALEYNNPGFVKKIYYRTSLKKIYCYDKYGIYDSIRAARVVKIYIKNEKPIKCYLLWLIIEDEYVKVARQCLHDTTKNTAICPIDSIEKIGIKNF